MRHPLTKIIAARFSGEREVRCDAVALLAHAALLGAFALLCRGVLSPALFMVIGVCAYVRNFNALHEASHARGGRGNPLRWLHQFVMIVHGPLQPGRAELAQAHRYHHAFPGDPARDPHVAVGRATWWTAALAACFGPEVALVRHVRRERRISRSLAATLLYNAAMCAALGWFAGAQIVWWIAVTRLGSTAVWFIFDWILHRPRVWSRTPAFTPGPVVSLVWSALFSRDNLNATRFHALHHRFGFVADRELPALARFMAASEESESASTVATG